MEAEAAKRALEIHCQADAEPALTVVELAYLLERMAVRDAEGRSPTDTEWVPCYGGGATLAAAVAEGWEIKAAKCVTDVTFSADGSGFSNSHKHDHCLKQAAAWRRKVVVSVPMTRPVVSPWP